MKLDPLTLMNERLEGLDDFLDLPQQHYPNIFIVGVPRSGTTLLHQLMASSMEVGYIDNLVASFWSAPAMGSLLSRKLNTESPFFGVSEYGRTKHVSEPHEFGKFWRDLLGYEDMIQKKGGDKIDWSSVVSCLNRISSAQGMPVVYKVFLLYWHLYEFHTLQPDSRWVFIERDLIPNAASLLKVRLDFTGDIKDWVSAVPLKALHYFDGATHFQQVLAQVTFINEWINQQLSMIAPQNAFKLSLENLLANPVNTMSDLASFCGVSIDLKKIDVAKTKLDRMKTIRISPYQQELVSAAKDMGL